MHLSNSGWFRQQLRGLDLLDGGDGNFSTTATGTIGGMIL
jgi:hypothetical protein